MVDLLLLPIGDADFDIGVGDDASVDFVVVNTGATVGKIDLVVESDDDSVDFVVVNNDAAAAACNVDVENDDDDDDDVNAYENEGINSDGYRCVFKNADLR